MTSRMLPIRAALLATALACAASAMLAGSAFAAAVTRAVGSAPLSDAQAAGLVVRSAWEPRPGNGAANNRVPTAAELETFRALHRARGSCFATHASKVTGRFTGRTDEVLQWAAHKWGVEENILRAMGVRESWWHMSAVGDSGHSFGILQIRNPSHPGTWPLSKLSTAFNADYTAMSLRRYFDGCETWLNRYERGSNYVAGDIWGSVGAWNAGRWYTDRARAYIGYVTQHRAQRTWLTF